MIAMKTIGKEGSASPLKNMKIIKLNLISFFFLLLSLDFSAREIYQSTFVYADKPDIEVFYSLPEEVNDETMLLFIIHGASRTAEGYLEDFLPHIQEKNLIAVAPKFSKESYPHYAFLNRSAIDGKKLPAGTPNIDNALGDIFEIFSSKYKVRNDKYRIYGHSGGAQFVQRYLLFSNDSRIDKAVLANAGFYTFMNQNLYPFGLRDIDLDDEEIKRVLRTKVALYVGENDTERNFRSLKGARAQGKNRLARGETFFLSLVSYAEELKMPFRWQYQIIKNVGHDNAGMTSGAAYFILEDL